MSALTKPLIHTVDTVGGVAQPVNAEKVIELFGQDEIAADGSVTRYNIVFKMGDYPRSIVWTYAASATRDTDLAAVIAAISTNVTP